MTESQPQRIGAKAVGTALWRLFHAVCFYPIIIGVFVWLYIRQAHWAWGVCLIGAILVFDPIWKIIGRSFLSFFRRK